MKFFILPALLTLSLTVPAFAKLSCYNNDKDIAFQWPVFTATVEGNDQLTHVTWYDLEGKTSSVKGEVLKGSLLFGSHPFKEYLYFKYGIALPPDFANIPSFTAAIFILGDEMDGSVYDLYCVNK